MELNIMNGVFRQTAMIPDVGVIFPFTIEIMDAIVAGLNPRPGDTILSVTGCGDQVFALLEKGARVTAIDVNQSQLDLLKRRKDALIRDDSLSGFFGTPHSPVDIVKFTNRLKYFENGRYENLRRNLGNLEILPPTSLEEITSNRKFNKIYASDAIGELYCQDSLESSLLTIVGGIERSGLLYVSNGLELDNSIADISKLGLQKDDELTKSARNLEYVYIPNVYRRIDLSTAK